MNCEFDFYGNPIALIALLARLHICNKGYFSMFDPREKIALFIDGANLYATSRALGFDIDYRKLLSSFQKRGYLLRAYYYTALVEDQEYSSIRPLIDWLDYNGFKVVTKPAKEFTDSTGRRKIKGNMDIELTVDALELADVVDHYVIFSGDGDFRTLVEALQRRGRKVSRRLDHGLAAADDLRRSAPPGRPFHRPDDAEERSRPRSVRTARAPARTGRSRRGRLLRPVALTASPLPNRSATARSARACMTSSPSGGSASRPGSTRRCRPSCRRRARTRSAC